MAPKAEMSNFAKFISSYRLLYTAVMPLERDDDNIARVPASPTRSLRQSQRQPLVTSNLNAPLSLSPVNKLADDNELSSNGSAVTASSGAGVGSGERLLFGVSHPPALCLLVFVLTLFMIITCMDRLLPSAQKSAIKDEFGLTDSQTAYPLTVFLVVYTAGQLLFSDLADRGYDRRLIITCSVVLWCGATSFSGVATDFITFNVLRGLVGLGSAAYVVCFPAIIADNYRPKDRNTMLAIVFLSIPLGVALGYGLGGTLAADIGWRNATVALSLPGCILALLMLFTVDPVRGGMDDPTEVAATTADSQQSFFTVSMALFRNRAFMIVLIGTTLQNFGVGGSTDWLPFYLGSNITLSDNSTDNQKLIDTIAGITVIVGGLIGIVLGAVLGDAGKRIFRNSYLAVSGWATLMAAFALAGALILTSPIWLIVVLLTLYQIGSWMPFPPMAAMVTNIVPAQHRTRAIALLNLFQTGLGGAIAPPIIGALSDAYNLQFAVSLIPISWVFAAAVLVIGSCFLNVKNADESVVKSNFVDVDDVFVNDEHLDGITSYGGDYHRANEVR